MEAARRLFVIRSEPKCIYNVSRPTRRCHAQEQSSRLQSDDMIVSSSSTSPGNRHARRRSRASELSGTDEARGVVCCLHGVVVLRMWPHDRACMWLHHAATMRDRMPEPGKIESLQDGDVVAQPVGTGFVDAPGLALPPVDQPGDLRCRCPLILEAPDHDSGKAVGRAADRRIAPLLPGPPASGELSGLPPHGGRGRLRRPIGERCPARQRKWRKEQSEPILT